MIKIVVSGACGRMGSRVIANLIAQKDMKLSGALEREGHPGLGKNLGEVLHIGEPGVKLSSAPEEVIKNCDVLIEFSSPEATLEHLHSAAKNKKAAVVGTTGFTSAQLDEIKELAKNIPCVLSPNMSIGVNLLFKLCRETAGVLKDYDVEIVEAHHNFKKDAPSGTALKIANVISETLGLNLEKSGVYGRKGVTCERKKGEIGIHSVRGGDIAGDHTVIFAGPGERIELTHRASSRDAFALGALKAIRFVVNAKPGLYDIESVIKMEVK